MNVPIMANSADLDDVSSGSSLFVNALWGIFFVNALTTFPQLLTFSFRPATPLSVLYSLLRIL